MSTRNNRQRTPHTARRTTTAAVNTGSLDTAARTHDATRNLISVTVVGGQPTKLDLNFDGPVTVNPETVPSVTDLLATSGGETTRHAIAYAIIASNIIRATMDGAPTSTKTYACTLLLNAGSIVAFPARNGTATGNVAIP